MVDIRRKIIVTSEFRSALGKGGTQQVDNLTKSTTALNKTSKKTASTFGTVRSSITRLRIAYFNIAVLSGIVIGSFGKLLISAEKTRFEFQRLALASSSSFSEVKESVEEVRRSTLATNKELIESFQELAKSGFELAEAQDIVAASSGASLIGFASLKDTALATAQILRQFGIASEESSDVSFKLAAAANAGKVDIETLGQALKFSGAIASQTGTSFEELAASTAILSNKGLRMTQIGRGQRQALLSLLSPSAQAENVMRAYDIQIRDTNGELVSFTNIISEFDRKLDGLSEAEKQNIIGKIFPSNAITIILESLGETNEAVIELTESLSTDAGLGAEVDSIVLLAENAVTMASAWESFKLSVLDASDAFAQSFGRTTARPAEDVEALKDEIIELGKETDALSETAKESIADITGERVITEGVNEGLTVFFRRDIKLLDDLKEKLLEVKKAQEERALAEGDAVDVTEEETKVVDRFTAILDNLSSNYNIARIEADKFADDVRRIKEELGDNEQAQQVINQLLKDYVEIISVSKGRNIAEIFSDITKETLDSKDATKAYKDEIAELRDSLSQVGRALSKVRTEIGDVNDEIGKIQSRRFTIRGVSETNILDLIEKQEIELKKAEFAALGLGSAEEFLRTATLITSESINDQTEALERLSDAASDGQSQFEAWKTTLTEAIRALLINSQDLDKDVTDVVRNLQTELLSVSEFRTGDGAFGIAIEEQLDRLGLAQSIFFGSERQQLTQSERLYEDRTNGVNTSAQAAISALESERSALSELREEEEDLIDTQDRLRDDIEELIAKMRELEDSARDAASAISSIGSGSFGGRTPSFGGGGVSFVENVSTGFGGGFQAALDDALAGGGERIGDFFGGGGTTPSAPVTINAPISINGNQKEPKETAREIKQEIQSIR